MNLTGKVLTTGNVLKITIFALPMDLTNLEVTFKGTEIGTRVLKLNKGGSPITFAACKLHRLTGITLPKLLDTTGEYVEWDQEGFVEPIHWDN